MSAFPRISMQLQVHTASVTFKENVLGPFLLIIFTHCAEVCELELSAFEGCAALSENECYDSSPECKKAR